MENSLSSSIARQCFVFGGASVFLARNMYYASIGSVDNGFQDYCLENFGSYKTENTPKQSEPSIEVYPNPTNNELGFYAVSNTHAKGVLTNSIGQAVRQLEVEKGFNTINTTGLATGVYVLNLVTDEGTAITHRVVIK